MLLALIAKIFPVHFLIWFSQQLSRLLIIITIILILYKYRLSLGEEGISEFVVHPENPGFRLAHT